MFVKQYPVHCWIVLLIERFLALIRAPKQILLQHSIDVLRITDHEAKSSLRTGLHSPRTSARPVLLHVIPQKLL